MTDTNNNNSPSDPSTAVGSDSQQDTAATLEAIRAAAAAVSSSSSDTKIDAAATLKAIRAKIAAVPDFPKPGVVFRSIQPLLSDAVLGAAAFRMMADQWRNEDVQIVAGLDARGFIVGSMLAHLLGAGFVMLRKPGKLPLDDPVCVKYGLEYGSAELQVDRASIPAGARVLVADDLLATGGTALAACEIVLRCGGVIAGAAFMIELGGLGGRGLVGTAQAAGVAVRSLLTLPADGSDVAGSGPGARAEQPPKITEVKRPSLEGELLDDRRAVVMCHPSMDALADDMCTHHANLFRRSHIRWGKFPDGYPDLQFDHVDALEGRDVLFLGSLRHPDAFLETNSLGLVLASQHVRSLRLVFPYFGPGTMERVDREGVVATAETVARMVSSDQPVTRSGRPELVVYDLHTEGNRFYFNHKGVAMRLRSAIPILVRRVLCEPALGAPEDDGRVTAVVFPDAGAAKRNKHFFEEAGFPIVVCSKERGEGDRRTVRVAERINWPRDAAMQQRALRHALIVDDICHSGGTLHECHLALRKEFGKVSAFVTHGVFPHGRHREFLPGGAYAGLHRFFITDTVPETSFRFPRFTSAYEDAKLSDAGGTPFRVLSIVDDLAHMYARAEGKQTMPFSGVPLHVYVASANKAKLAAAESFYRTKYGSSGRNVRIFSVPVKSGVNEQPLGREEGARGARNRWHAALCAVNSDETHRAMAIGGALAHIISFESYLSVSASGEAVGDDEPIHDCTYVCMGEIRPARRDSTNKTVQLEVSDVLEELDVYHAGVRVPGVMKQVFAERGKKTAGAIL